MNKAIPALIGLMLVGILGFVLFDSFAKDDAISKASSQDDMSRTIGEKSESARRETSPASKDPKAVAPTEADDVPLNGRNTDDRRDFHAVVLSEQGAPVPGVGVSFLRRKRKILLSGGKPRLSDEEGRVTVSMSARRVLESARREQGAFAWRLDGLFPKPLWFDVDVSATAASPQELRLPPFGWVELEFRGEDGRVVEEWIDVHFLRQGRSSGGVPVYQSKVRAISNADAVFLQGRSKAGSLRLGPVALGEHLRGYAEGKTPGGLGRTELEFAGPVHDSEVVTRQVRWKPRPMFSGRALSASGEVLADLSLRIRLGRRVGNRFDGEVLRTVTDGEGRFQFRWPESQLPDPEQRTSVEFSRTDQDPESPDSQRARRDVTERFRQSNFDLGDLRLGPPPLIGSGRIVDGRGRPVIGASLEILKKTERHDERIPDREPRVHWGRMWDLSASSSDEQGFFRIFGFYEGTELLGAEAKKEGLSSSAIVEFEPGATNILLIMKQSGGLAFNLVPGQGMKVDDFICLLDAPNAEPRRLVPLKTLGNRKESGDLEPGLYRLRILTAGDNKKLLTRSDIMVDAGQVTDLGDLDPVANLHVYVLNFVDRRDEALSGVQVSWKSADPKTPPGFALALNGPCRFVSEASSVVATIKRKGFLTRQETLQAGRTTIRLESGISARIKVFGAWPELSEKESIRYFMTPTHSKRGGMSASAGSDGRATIDLAEAGPHALTFLLLRRDGRSVTSEGIQGQWPDIILDVKTSALQEFEFRLPDAFSTALERTRKKLRDRAKSHR